MTTISTDSYTLDEQTARQLLVHHLRMARLMFEAAGSREDIMTELYRQSVEWESYSSTSGAGQFQIHQKWVDGMTELYESFRDN